MGSILVAECTCGYKSDFMGLGGGMADFEARCNVPVVCFACGILFVRNMLSKNNIRCPRCRKKGVILGNFSQPHEEMGEPPIFNWLLDDNKEFILPETSDSCPKCKQKKMRFINSGEWD